MQRPDIYDIVWGGTMRYRDRSVDVVVRKIRGKLELWAPAWRYIHTHFAVGYRFHPERIAAGTDEAPPRATVRDDGSGGTSTPGIATLRSA